MQLSHSDSVKKAILGHQIQEIDMADRYDLPKIKPNKAPSMINGEAAGWGLAGGIAGGVIANLLARGNIAVGLIGAWGGQAIGSVFGGLKGKTKQEKEQVEGRVVKTAGYWNRGIINGWAVGALVSAPFVLLAKAGRLPPVAILLAGLGELGAMIVGSVMRKNSLQNDLDQAIAIQQAGQRAAQGMMQPAAQMPQQGVSYMNNVSADEAAELTAKQNASASNHQEKQQERAAEMGAEAVAGRA